MVQRVSRLFWPVVVVPKNAAARNSDAISKSQKLMIEMGLLKPIVNGTFNIMPLAQRSLDKLCKLIADSMHSVDGQKITLSLLTPSDMWKRSGRLNGNIEEFFMLHDRHQKQFLLSPTHEEAVTGMLAAIAPISYKQLPLRLYQIGQKFRDELKARFGLIRSKEFLMKDLYTFDRTKHDAQITYDEINECYHKLFEKLDVPFLKVEANTGIMGGKLSHEYHYRCETGEDHLKCCNDCNFACNMEITIEDQPSSNNNVCPKCLSSNITEIKAVEVAHTFLLDQRYSKAFNATYLNNDGKPNILCMGSYGIGISRLLAACLEVLSTETELIWPTLLSPYNVCIIGPKAGSKQQDSGDIVEQQITQQIADICNHSEVLLDDRKHLTIGKRLLEAKRMGYPIIVVVGSNSILDVPKIELYINGKHLELEINDLLAEISSYQKQLLTKKQS